MNINEAFEFLNFWIQKERGVFYTIAELTEVVDRGQMSLFEDLQSKYATSQRIKDALSPFRDKYVFSYFDTLEGLIEVPENKNYLSLLDCHIVYDISGRGITKQVPIQLVNEDVRSLRLDSQIDPVLITAPIGEMVGKRQIQLYPKVQYRGEVTFLRRPIKPVFGYSVISGRVIVYNENTSTQLEWSENWQNAVLAKSLSSIGINLSSEQVTNYAQTKTDQNFQNVNML